MNQSTHSSVAYSTESMLRQGPRRPMTSVLYSSMMLGERVVERVADAADRRLDASRGKTLGALYTAKFPARTRWTSTRSSSSRFAREGSFSGASLRARNSR